MQSNFKNKPHKKQMDLIIIFWNFLNHNQITLLLNIS